MSGERKPILIRFYTQSHPVGFCRFVSLLPNEPGAYSCEPEGLLSESEVQELRDQLRQLPAIHSGTVGRYRWEEELA